MLLFIALLISFLFVYWAVYKIQRFYREKLYKKTTCKILGVIDVIRYDYHRGEKIVKDSVTVANVEFKTNTGEIYRLKSAEPVPNKYSVNQVVTFYYDPRNVEDNDFTLNPPLLDVNRFTLSLIIGVILPGTFFLDVIP